MTVRSVRSFRAPAVAALLVAAITGTAQASVVIDFQALEVAGNPSPTIGPLDYVEDGYRVVLVNGSRFGTSSIAYYGSTAVFSESFFSTPPGITLTQVASGGFDLLSIDLVELGNSLVSQITLTGFFVGGGSISTTLTTDGFQQTGNPASFETFALTGFSNLAEVRFSYPSNSSFLPQMDNLVVQPTIPTPGAAAALAMGGLLVAGRRRRA
jgi:hypothetical protein